MKIIKHGGHRLFEEDAETSRYVFEMLQNLRKNGMDAVRKYSREFDQWDPPSFELSESEIKEAIGRCDDQVIRDTDYCQANVRAFAEAQLATMQPLEVEIRPGVVLGHKHIPVDSVGSYIPGGRYPMFGSAQMSIIPAKVAGVKTGGGVHSSGQGRRVLPGNHQRDEEGRRGPHLHPRRCAGLGADGVWAGRCRARRCPLRRG